MSNCPDPLVLDAVALGTAERAASERIRAHAEECATCGPLLTELVRLYASNEASADPALALTVASNEAPAAKGRASTILSNARLVGRYQILEKLGQGAMGEVLVAYDPQLDRRVAVKVLHADPLIDPRERRLRLVREAQSMAKLAHPHVVTVFDVGVDDATDQVFVAMELVLGETLGAWLSSARRPQREILDAFIQAGKGLAAAHEAGLVHRDFKPDNVLVGRDGRVRVGDFGLARAPLSSTTLATSDEAVAHHLTTTGAIVGTPAYMAPEQLRGEAADASTDQFAFAIALYEALFGVRPFEGRTFGELRDNVLNGRHRSFADLNPRWIRSVFERALSPLRSARFPSMNALVSMLTRASTERRQRSRWIAGVMALVFTALAASSFVAYRRGYGIHKTPLSCRDAPKHVDELYAPPDKPPDEDDTDASRARKKKLDEYATTLRASFVDACERSALPPSARDQRRNECLEGRLRALVASSKSTKESAAADVDLPSIALCSDAIVLDSDLEPPPSQAAREEADRIRAELAEADQEIAGWDPKPANERLTRALADAEKLAYDPVTAETLVRVARLAEKSSRFRDAKEALTRAVDLARASKDDAVLFDATLDLAHVVGVDLGSPSDAETWLGFARAELKRRPPDRDGSARLAFVIGEVLRRAQKLDEARTSFEEALKIREDISGRDSVEVARVLRELAATRIELGDAEGAERDAKRANDIVRADSIMASGLSAPSYELTLASAHLAGKNWSAALEDLERAKTIAKPFGSFDAGALLAIADGEARASFAMGDLDTARLRTNEATAGLLDDGGDKLVFVDPSGGSRSSVAIDFATRIRSKVDRPDDAFSIAEANAFAAMRAVEGDEPAALKAIDAGMKNEEKNPSFEASTRGALYYNRALLMLRVGDLALAQKSIDLARSAFEREMGRDNIRTAMAELLSARILARLNSPEAKDAASAALTVFRERAPDSDRLAVAARSLGAAL